MGHNICTLICDDTQSARDDAERKIANIARHSGDGLYEGFHWDNLVVYGSKKEALEHLNDVRGEYENLAVPFRDTFEAINAGSKRLTDLRKRHADLCSKYFAYSEEHPAVKHGRGEFITCKRCGSKLSREHMSKIVRMPNANACPVCGADLRPKSVLDAIERYKKRLAELERAIEDECDAISKKAAKDAPKRWLIMFEYHS